jgi:hypothetical protein
MAGAPACNEKCQIDVWYHPDMEALVKNAVEVGIREGIMRGPIIILPEEPPLSTPEDC